MNMILSFFKSNCCRPRSIQDILEALSSGYQIALLLAVIKFSPASSANRTSLRSPIISGDRTFTGPSAPNTYMSFCDLDDEVIREQLIGYFVVGIQHVMDIIDCLIIIATMNALYKFISVADLIGSTTMRQSKCLFETKI